MHTHKGFTWVQFQVGLYQLVDHVVVIYAFHDTTTLTRCVCVCVSACDVYMSGHRENRQTEPVASPQSSRPVSAARGAHNQCGRELIRRYLPQDSC